jgi:hypothetical protein
MSESLELVRPEENPQHLMRRATDVAGVSREIVLKTAMTIQGRKYVRVEGWQAIAVAHGCVASSKDVERTESGFRAIGEIRRVSDGAVIATAEGFVGDDELATWAKRPEYAKRAMAQTRAISRACRSAFAHVVVLIDSNLSTTPAEEVPDEGFNNEPAPPKPAAPRPAQKTTIVTDAAEGDEWNTVLHFGKNKGTTLRDLDSNSLSWYMSKWEPKEWPAGSGKFSDADVRLRAALNQIESDRAGQLKKVAAEVKAAPAAEEDPIPF